MSTVAIFLASCNAILKCIHDIKVSTQFNLLNVYESDINHIETVKLLFITTYPILKRYMQSFNSKIALKVARKISSCCLAFTWEKLEEHTWGSLFCPRPSCIAASHFVQKWPFWRICEGVNHVWIRFSHRNMEYYLVCHRSYKEMYAWRKAVRGCLSKQKYLLWKNSFPFVSLANSRAPLEI